MAGVLVLLAAAVLVLSVLLAHRNRRRNELIGRLPGPAPFVPLFGNTLEILARIWWSGGDIIDVAGDLVDKHGSVYKLWSGHQPLIIITNPDDAEVVLTHPAVADKGRNYKLLSPWLGDGILLAGGKKWHTMRKMLSPAFSVRVLDTFMPLFNKHAAILEDKLRERAGQAPFDIVPLMGLCALDIISETSMGVQIHAQTQEDSDYVRAVKTTCRSFFIRQVLPWLRNDALLALTATGRDLREATGVLRGMTAKVITQRCSEIASSETGAQPAPQDADDVGLKQRAALLDHMLTLRGQGITDEAITDEVSTFMFAGQDTTMTALCFTLHMLSVHPAVQERVLDEVRDVVGDGAVEPQHLNELKYLECVIKETLRLYPSVPVIVRNCTSEFDLPSGYTMPVGAQVGINILHLHRNPDVFPRPLDFDPDRFLDGGGPSHRFGYLPFSASLRNCIGQRFAMMEMKTILARLVRSFSILPPRDGYKLRLKTEIVLGAEGGVLLSLQKR